MNSSKEPTMFGNRRRPPTPLPDGDFTPASMFTTVAGIEIGLSRQPADDRHPPTWSVSAYAAGTWWTGQRDQLDDAQELAGALGPVLRRLEDAAGLANLAAHRARELLAGDQAGQRRPPPSPPIPAPSGPYRQP
jgi:hypothetical protein